MRVALRGLRRAPGFTATVVLTLALGIGAVTAVFCALDRMLLRDVPFPDPDRLVALHETETGKGYRPISLANLLDWRAQCGSFAGMAGFRTRSFGLGKPVHVIQVGMVTADMFAVVGRQPARGRGFTEAEEAAGAPVMLISDALWARQFNRAPGTLGRTVRLNEEPRTVIGILPPEFAFPAPDVTVDAYIPLSRRDYGARGTRALEAVARLKPGVGIEAARAELRAVGQRVVDAWPAENRRGGADLESLDAAWKGGVRRPLLLLMGAALLVLAIASTNVVNLMLARALARQKEASIRVALGARFGHLVRQALGEALLLSLAGGALGLCAALALVEALPAVLRLAGATRLPGDLTLEMPAMIFAAAVALGSTLVCGLAPVLPSAWPVRLRQGLVVGQVALSLMLLLSAGLLLRVFVKLAAREPGFRSEQVWYFGFGIPEARYPERAMLDFHRRLRARLEEIPGVAAAGTTFRLPLDGRNPSTAFQFEDAAPGVEGHFAAVNLVDPGFFAALRIPLVKGRLFSWEQDGVDRPAAVVVNRSFERVYGTGKRLRTGWWSELNPRGQLWSIVGVVGDTYQAGLDQAIRPQIYIPATRMGLDGGAYVVRTARTDPGLAAAAREAVRSVDPQLERIEVKRLEDWVGRSLAPRRMPAVLSAAFAGVGLVLTALGLYGIVAFQVGRRRREIAIRMAVGARPGSLIGLVMRQGLGLAAAGGALGLAGCAVGNRVLASQLYEVEAGDPWTAGAVVVILAACAGLACVIPARAAIRADPVAILKDTPS